MNPPKYRNDINGVLPQLKQTVQDICNYLPSQRLASNSLQIDEHSNGTVINTKDSQDIGHVGGSSKKDTKIIRYAQQLHMLQLKKSGATKRYEGEVYGDYRGITTGAFFTCMYLNTFINGQPMSVNVSDWPSLTGEADISAYLSLSYRNGIRIDDVMDILSSYTSEQYVFNNDSYINGSVRLKLSLVSGFVYDDLSGMTYPPVGYVWDLEPELTWTDASVYNVTDKTNVLFRNGSTYYYLYSSETSPSAYYIPLGDFCIYRAKDYLTAVRHHQTPNDFSYSMVFTDYCQMPQINLTYTPSMLQHVSNANMELNNAT